MGMGMGMGVGSRLGKGLDAGEVGMLWKCCDCHCTILFTIDHSQYLCTPYSLKTGTVK